MGGQSSSSSTNQTSNQDNRVGADNGAVVAQGGSTVIVKNLDRAAIDAALGSNTAVANNAVNANAAVASQSTTAAEQMLADSLGFGQHVTDLVSQTISSNKALENDAASVINQAITIAQNQNTRSLEYVLLAGTAVATVWFLSRGH